MKRTNLDVIDFNITGGNENYLNFTATAGYVGKPTRATPTGGIDGYTVILGDGENVSELVGAGVNCSYGANGFKKHDKSFKIGVIDNAALEGDRIKVVGHLWKSDFPDVCDTIECAKDALGCSVEVYGLVETDEESKTQKLNDVHFTGMSIVYKSKAAFDGTQFMCAIAEKEEKSLTEEEIKKKIEEEVEKRVGALKAELASSAEKESSEKEVKEELDFSKLTNELLSAIKEGFVKMQKEMEKLPAPSRKTQQFASEAQFNQEETLIDLSKKIDDDATLTPEQKWAAQMRLWLDRDKKSA